MRIFQRLLIIALPFVIAVALIAVLHPLLGRPILLTAEPMKVSVLASPGETVKARYVVRNNTAEPVKLLGYNCECSCLTVTNDFPIELPAHGSVAINVEMLVGQAAGPKYSKEFRLVTNRTGSIPALVLEASVPTPSR